MESDDEPRISVKRKKSIIESSSGDDDGNPSSLKTPENKVNERKELQTFGTPKKSPRRQYDTSLLWEAYKEVTVKGMSVYKAARLYGVPESTLRDRTLGMQPAVEAGEDLPKSGPATVFTRNEEKLIVEHVSYMSSIGYGYGRKEFLKLVTDYANMLGTRSSADPALTHSWLTGFKKRNPEIALARPKKLSISKAQSTCEEELDNYFGELQSVMEKYDISEHPECIWNTDEIALQMEHSRRNEVSMKGQTSQALSRIRGKTVTLIAAGGATGMRIPPYFVFPGKRWKDELLDGTCPGSAGTMSESGSANSNVYMDYFENHFKKYVPTGDHTILVLFDGSQSDISLTLATWGEANKVIFFALPQHLDVGCFSPLKKAYNTECQAYLWKNPGMKIDRCNVADIACKVYFREATAENLISSFRKTGIYPLDRHAIEQGESAISTINTHTENDNIIDINKDLEDDVAFLSSKKVKGTVVEKKKKKKRECKPITGDSPSPSKKTLLKVKLYKTPAVSKKGAKVSSSKKSKSVKEKS